ncbi:MAG: type II toxin-antitoxin system MqsA family antitoxin [bacterium]
MSEGQGKRICPVCKGEMKKTSVNFPVDLRTHFILIKGVPARVCKQCGEFYINDKIHKQIERIVKKVEETTLELESIKFAT